MLHFFFMTVKADRRRCEQTLEITQGKHSVQRSVVNKTSLEYLKKREIDLLPLSGSEWLSSLEFTHFCTPTKMCTRTCKLTVKALLLNPYQICMSQQDTTAENSLFSFILSGITTSTWSYMYCWSFFFFFL